MLVMFSVLQLSLQFEFGPWQFACEFCELGSFIGAIQDSR